MGDALYLDNADVDLKKYNVREVHRISSSVVLFLDDKFVLKMCLATFDIERIVNLMRLASTVVPVPQVYKYGHSGNCTFVLMEQIHGLQLGKVQRFLAGSQASSMARVERQIDLAVQRLAEVGLSHNDIVPRNIFINDYWEIIGIVDWDYCTALDPAREYIHRVKAHISGYDRGQLQRLYLNPIHWNHSYVRQAKKSRCMMDIVDIQDTYHRPPFLQLPCTRITHESGSDQSRKPRLLLSPSMQRRIAIMSSIADMAVRRLMEACETGRVPNAAICVLFSERPEQSSPFTKDCFTHTTFPIYHLPTFPSITDSKGKPWRDYDEDVGRLIVRECPDVVIQVGWTLRLLEAFWEAMLLPRLIIPDDQSPVPVVWVCKGLPDQLQNPKLEAEEIIPWAYNALQRNEIETTGFSVWRWSKGHFKIMYTREVEAKEGETFVDFEARMLEHESHILEEIVSKCLDGRDPIPC